jgi:hypothetical protein
MSQSNYSCVICNTNSDNQQHHTTHLKTNKHKLIKENKILELRNQSISEDEIIKIVKNLETKKKIYKKIKKINKKIKPNETIIWESDSSVEDVKDKTKIISLVKKAHQIFYDNQITIATAMSDFMNLLSLTILKPIFNDTACSYWEKINQVKIDKKITDANFKKYINYSKDMVNLTKQDNINNEWRNLVKDFLEPLFKGLFVSNDTKLNCKNNSCLIKIINCFNELPDIIGWDMSLSKEENYLNSRTSYPNLTGDIHEYFKNSYGGTGKELGQFFTPTKLINGIKGGCNLNEKYNLSNNSSLYDPCVGSAGILNNIYQDSENNINELYGVEIAEDTIKWAYQSLLITTGEIPKNLTLGDSIVNIPKADCNIFTNCPFDIRMNYKKENDDFDIKVKEQSLDLHFIDMYPIKINDVEALFLQHCVYNLGDNCTCAIVLPYGKLFESKEKRFLEFRKWLINSVDITEIMLVPRGVFDYANVLTCVMVFTKKKKTDGITKFLRINKECSQVYHLFDLSHEDIKHGTSWCDYSLCHSDYIHHELPSKLKGELVTFRDVFTLESSNISSGTIEHAEDGEYKFVTGAKYVNWKSIDSYDFEGEYIFIGVGGNGDSVPVKYYNGKFKFSNLMGKLIINDKYKDRVNVKYFYNMLLKNQSYIEENMQKGSSNRTLQDNRLNSMYLTIPPMEEQILFVENIRKFDEETKNFELKLKTVHDNQRKFIDDYF